MKQTAKVYGSLLARRVSCVYFNEVGAADDILETPYTNLCKILPYVLGEEGEEVDNIVRAAAEMAAQPFILGSYSHRAGIGAAFAHHYATEDNQGQGAERELVSSEHCHKHNIPGGFELAVNLETNLIP